MAGDWIKVEKATPRKPEVLRIATLLAIHPDHAFGLCFRFWSWCDEQLESGHAFGVTQNAIDVTVSYQGFADALVEVGWLNVENDQLSIPNFDAHLSENAKKRAESTKRKRKQRQAVVADMSRKERDKSATREEKRRVITNGPSKPGSNRAPTRTPDTGAVDQMDQGWISVEDLQPTAAQIFRRTGYAGDQGKNLWKIAALQKFGLLSEAEVVSACEGARLNGHNPPAHAYACLRESLARRGVDLAGLLKRVKISPTCPSAPPEEDLS